ncbi:hypothetical protein ACDY96_07560 [Rhizobium mongolense]|uniref:hypothetical protein n=1 Tax=Rhizobium TaxID=379 RepID=UPI00093D7E5A|nr:hypothetical protein [Rhizobium gallicum]QPB20626.1 hypothetical protein ISN39_03715 [Rhizobium sp. 007]ULJ70613.1 hypothetical protein L2W42_11640 [Rhizobium gallicum]
MRRHLRILAALLTLSLISAGPADDGRFYAGDYSFSDELGGFRILSVTGSGTKADPIEIHEELNSASPVTLVIRAARPIQHHGFPEGAFHLRVVTLNKSGLAWIEFEFELQEILGKPSDFYDGLSFDQTNPNPDLISSNRFARFENHFEKFDRLRFASGHVDPLDRPAFGFFITDVTPVTEFYLVQDPRVPFS